MNLSNPTLLQTISNKIHHEQIQINYDLTIAPSPLRPSVSCERDIEKIYNPIICGRTKCIHQITPVNIEDDLERCK